MARRTSARRQPGKVDGELNLIPIMNLVLMLIPAILITAAFVQITVIHASAPQLDGSANLAEPPTVEKQLRQKIARLSRPLEEAGVPGQWTEADKVHLTLKFIGEVPAAEVDPISDALEEVAGSFRPFEMKFGAIGAFPSPRRPRVVWLGVEFNFGAHPAHSY